MASVTNIKQRRKQLRRSVRERKTANRPRHQRWKLLGKIKCSPCGTWTKANSERLFANRKRAHVLPPDCGASSGKLGSEKPAKFHHKPGSFCDLYKQSQSFWPVTEYCSSSHFSKQKRFANDSIAWTSPQRLTRFSVKLSPISKDNRKGGNRYNHNSVKLNLLCWNFARKSKIIIRTRTELRRDLNIRPS